MQSPFVCARCGLSVRLWRFGWKHSGGGKTKKSCGQKPTPVKRHSLAPANTDWFHDGHAKQKSQ